MKQAEHPPATAGASIAAEYSLAIIDQLARIDRSRSKEEMDELVYRLLSLIGGIYQKFLARFTPAVATDQEKEAERVC